MRTEGSSPCGAWWLHLLCVTSYFQGCCVNPFIQTNRVSNSRKHLEGASRIFFMSNIPWVELLEVFLLRAGMLTNIAHMHRKIICTWYKERVEIIYFGSC